MNDELNINDEQVRLATMHLLPDDAPIDAETAALRESFLALGDALDVAAGEFDKAALVAKLRCASKTNDFAGPVARAATADNFQHWQWLLGGALALSALLVVASLLSNWRSQPATVQAPVRIPVDRGPAIASDTHAATAHYAWDDILDEEIALTQAQIFLLERRSQGLDGSLSHMSQQLESFSQELLGEPL
jgi:hypothetical protein